MGVSIQPYSGASVDPGDVHAKQGNTITWQNTLNTQVVIQIPDSRIFGHPITQSIVPGSGFTSPPVEQDCPNGTYEYSVYCSAFSAGHRYAIGHSGPKIIIP